MICVPIGLLLSISLKGIDTSLIVTAIGLTAAVTIIMTIAAVMFPNFFSKLGPTLFITLIALLVVEIIAIFTGMSTGWIDTICVVLFSLYIGYDYHVAQQYPKTLDNAIDSSIDIYLDVINLFIRILSILDKDD